METNLELAWIRATQGERQALIEMYSDDVREMLPAFDDRDSGDNELIGHEQDVGDDEQLDPAELPAVLDTNIGCSVSDDDGLTAGDDEEFHAAAGGNRRRATGKRVTAAPSKDDLQRMTKEFLERGGRITRVGCGASGVQPLQPRTPAWRRKIVSSNKGV